MPGLLAAVAQHSDSVVELVLPKDEGEAYNRPPLPLHHAFVPGDTVRLSTVGDGEHGGTCNELEGVIMDISPTAFLVQVERSVLEKVQLGGQEAEGKGKIRTWRLDRGFSSVTFERMLRGLKAVSSALPACDILEFVVASHPAAAAAALHSSPKLPAAKPQPRERLSPEVLASRFLLNSSQRQAVATACRHRVTLLQGAPWLHARSSSLPVRPSPTGNAPLHLPEQSHPCILWLLSGWQVS